MNMKSTFSLTFIAILMVAGLNSCKSKVSLDSMRKQQTKALTQLEDTREELLKLSTMKEQFSVDYRDARVKALESRQKQVNKDISSLKNIQSTGADEGKKDMLKNLETQNKNIDREISDLKKLKQENWATARDSINQRINELQSIVNTMTGNLSGLEEIKK